MSKKTVSILIVDDNTDFSTLLEHALRSRPVTIVSRPCVDSALDFLRSTSVLPTLTFVDLRLRDSSGEDLLRDIRADKKLKDLKVVLTSGASELAEVASRCGADGHLRKPFELAQFYQIVDAELKRI